ncbi:uncharacterized protein N7469_005482 [Penicillium citrinum]|uniref:Phosphoinositide phospholipase C n=1 Tax=Penicillium citrinum TaxID=5077 RepID=A0A9W9P1H5_PENCI|nr:uncharacterized protein N7469_005482 [Penicillium citrinum]KAJ5233716.1 hypothetical protein N7469_005482 [Penicillium citrinum]
METVEDLVERARHLSLHPLESKPIDNFHVGIDKHLQKIYESIIASETPRNEFKRTVQQDALSNADGSPLDPLASVDAFRSYMKADVSRAQMPAEELDCSLPISDYFVSSSHNTYLTGNQLYSDAAASAYTSVLLRGCRSVEIDVWDGEPLSPPESENGETSSESSSESSDSEDETKGSKEGNEGLKSRLKQRIKKKAESEEKLVQRLPKSVSARLGLGSKDPENTVAASPTAGTSDLAASDAREQIEASPVPAPDSSTAIKGEPRVLHGHTLTKGASFREIAYAIRDSAFVTSDLPVIVSFEIHASLDQQQIMVDIIHDAWKGFLVEIPAGTPADKLPKLAELKRKILIKTKSLPLKGTGEIDAEAEEDDEEEETESNDEPVDKSVSQDSKPAKKKPAKILEALAKLAVYTRAYHFSHFEQPEAKDPVHIFSLSEKGARDAHLNHRDALFEHNRSSLMRIYPFAFRVTSSNLDPSFYWRRGAQLVALNWQNLDKGMMLNHGMFTGTQGWVIKPTGYRSSEPRTDIYLQPRTCPCPPSDHNEKWFRPYVNCQLHVEEPESPVAAGQDDVSSDSEKSSYRRCTKSRSGINPDFEGQKLEFPTVSNVVEKLSFLRFKIKDDEIGRDSLAAWACIRLDRLREGYRLVHLLDCTGEKTGGILLVRIAKKTS